MIGLEIVAGALTLSKLIDRAAVSTIENLYESLGYDYAKTVRLLTPADEQQDKFFLSSIAWKATPNKEIVRRLFNQINAFYAERWLLEHLQIRPFDLLLELNRRLLFRQGKSIGFRERPIGYGYRVYLDFMDPFREMKWLAGASSEHIPTLVEQWSRSAECCTQSKSTALILAMFLIAIHPFVDGNGRIARLVYTWLCERWDLRGDNWLEEGSDGELLRTGHGLSSTECLMAQFMIALGNGANVIDPGSYGNRAASDQATMADSFRRHLLLIEAGKDVIHSHPSFLELLSHLETGGHFRKTSPRFNSLQSLIQ